MDVPGSEEVFDSFGSSVDLDTPVEAREDMECKEEEDKKPHQLEEVFGNSKQRELVLQVAAWQVVSSRSAYFIQDSTLAPKFLREW